ncbi:MAG: phosphodiester glycosidase family protein, partial [Clostridia bacterium]|nr:phosphodiester glycosidase family protein [Clostridia bacterium]
MKKIFSIALALALTLTLLPISALADVDYNLGTTDCSYYHLISQTDYNLAPGAVETEIVINDDTGNNRNVIHAIEVDLTNPNISVMPTNKNISETVDYTDTDNWGIQPMTEQAAYVEENLGLNVVGGMNVSLSWSFTHPYGLLIYNGNVLCDNRLSCDTCASGHPGGGYLVITTDGKAELRDATAPLEGNEWMAQTVCFSYLVRGGVNKASTEDHVDSSRAPRSVIGIKENGNLVIMMNDGRQAPYSAGFTNHEMAETMIALGCVDAINCDGGGSSTFLSEREGTNELTMKSSPSDGSERSTLSGILVISKAVRDGKFDHASLETAAQYVTPGSSVTFTATGADSAGGPAEIPAAMTWQLKDSSMGTVENGVFTSNGTVGEAVVQAVYNGNIVGESSVNVVIPDSISFVMD